MADGRAAVACDSTARARGRAKLQLCEVTTLDSSASASRMDQTGSTRSYLTSTTARGRTLQSMHGRKKPLLWVGRKRVKVGWQETCESDKRAVCKPFGKTLEAKIGSLQKHMANQPATCINPRLSVALKVSYSKAFGVETFPYDRALQACKQASSIRRCYKKAHT
eukprot:363999-Chlamydomonas_euryale.AAC.8